MSQYKVTLQETLIKSTKVIYVEADTQESAMNAALDMLGRDNHVVKDIKHMEE